MNNDSFLIEDSDLELARDICKDIEDNQVRNRAMANALASEIASKYFKEIEADTESGLHKITEVLEDLDIADIYLKGSYIDVRVYFNDNELCVPKSHFERNLLPVAYMFIKLETELSGGLVSGFVLPSSIDTSSSQDGYYFVKEEDLISYYDIEPLLVIKDTPDIPDNFESTIYDYLDGKLGLTDKNEFYNLLLESLEYRDFLKKAAKTKHILSFVSLVKPESEELVEEIEQLDALEINDDSLVLNYSEDDSMDFTDSTFELLSGEQVESLDSDLLEHTEDIVLSSNDSDEFTLQQENSSSNDEIILEAALEVDNLISTEDSDLLLNNETQNLDIEQTSFDVDSLTLEDLTNETEEDDENEQQILEEYAEQKKSENSFVTNTTPSLETIEYDINSEQEQVVIETSETISVEDLEQNEVQEDLSADFLLDLSEKKEEIIENEAIEDSSNISEILSEESVNNNEKQIDELFGAELPQENIDDEFVLPQKSSSSKLLPIIGLLVILGAVGYFAYNKFVNQEIGSKEVIESTPVSVPETKPLQETHKKVEAMPIETIENIRPIETINEGNAISIPAIEQNLNTSVAISNLSVLWEVPAGYVSNATAKRYFTKIGKIVQLNLKSELLLINKLPITNKFGVELEFNKSSNKFEVKNVTISSGDKAVDDLVQQIVKNALDLNLKINMNIFNTIVGNPTLIIRL